MDKYSDTHEAIPVVVTTNKRWWPVSYEEPVSILGKVDQEIRYDQTTN